jgi:ankyrin repeat protein
MRAHSVLSIVLIALSLSPTISQGAVEPGFLSNRPRALVPVRQLQLNSRLVRAVERTDLNNIRGLLEAGADPNWTGTNAFRSPLVLVAASRRSPESVALLLDFGADADARDSRGTPVLVSAASLLGGKSPRNDLRLLGALRELLIRGRANPDLKDRAAIGDDRSALHMAAANGSTALTRLLLEQGANPNLPNRFHETPLHFAAEHGYLEVAQLLIRSGAALNARSRFTRMTPLLAAAQNGHARLARLLIRMRADRRARDAFGEDPIRLASNAARKASTPELRKRYVETLSVLKGQDRS